MLFNYLKITLRNLRRRPGFTAINVGGLAIGLACSVLIMLFIVDELSFDKFNDNYDRLYRVNEMQATPEGAIDYAGLTAGPVGPSLVREMPEVQKAARLAGRYTIGRRTVEKGSNQFYEEHYFFADPEIFELFDFEWIQGDAQTALNEPNSVVLTEKAALQYFGNQNPVGQTLFFEGAGDLLVTGILENPPQNSHLNFNFLASFATIEAMEGWGDWLLTWDSSRILTYLLLNDPDDAPALEAKLPTFMQ